MNCRPVACCSQPNIRVFSYADVERNGERKYFRPTCQQNGSKCAILRHPYWGFLDSISTIFS
jgi:hypothetical protein